MQHRYRSISQDLAVDETDRMPDAEERFEVSCEPDLDAIKTLDLPALKDADPEVARFLNPDTRPTDPA